jgi:hypothetical protein
MVKEIPEEITKQLKVWYSSARILRIIHVFVGLIAIIASVTVASRILDPDNNYMSYVAWLAAIASSILTSLNLGTKSNNMRNAWRILNTAVLRYKTEEDFNVKNLNDAYEKGEKTIGDVEIDLS